jgi:hypothetical protein
MRLTRYDYLSSENFLDYEFKSEGPNGKIRKVVRFSPVNANGVTYFNLGFGDLDETTGTINDLAVSNNQDREKVLATIAVIVLEFTLHFPDIMVYAKGSTPARTRLYQMGIMANWDEIERYMHVYGFAAGSWERFRKHTSYEAFIVIRKKL